MKKSAFLMLLLASTAACTKIPTSSVGIPITFSGTTGSEPAQPGFNTSIFTSYEIIDLSQTALTVKDMHPKDAHGVFLKDVEVNVTYTLNPEKVIGFYNLTKELDREAGNDGYLTLGQNILTKSIIPFSVQLATEKEDLITISSALTSYADVIRDTITNRLNSIYGDKNPFIIQYVTVTNFQLPEKIQNQVDTKSGIDAEMKIIESQKQLANAKKELMTLQATIQAQALSEAAKVTGLSPEQITDWKLANNNPPVIIQK